MKRRFVQLPAGTQLPPKENRFAWPAANQQDDVLNYEQAAAQQTALDNTVLVRDTYLNTTFPNWLVNYSAGRIPYDAIPPAPPRGFVAVVTKVADEANAYDYDFAQLGPVVCDVPEYTKLPAPQR